jgi:biopolymer transport protein ExbD
MATIDVGGATARRALNRELTLVPFIDFLLCIVAFLLVTAVWTQMARVDASAAVPGQPPLPTTETVAPELHVDMRQGSRFVLEWRERGIVLSQSEAGRRPATTEDAVLRYPDLATQVVAQWEKSGFHRAATDPARDRAVLHAGNTAAFEEIVAAMDAIHAAKRPLSRGAVSAFDVVFAVD